ncbi:MAG: pyrroline-5-carboxylate reductase [bacterium]|nr:pyrroline-5-carboxylate reductase [bacterium]
MIDKTLGFIGVGNMGQALIKGLLKAGMIEPQRIVATDLDKTKLSILEDETGIRTTDQDKHVVVELSEAILLCVKPPAIISLLEQIAPVITSDKTIISIAAGIGTQQIEETVGEGIPVIRVMPNTPAMVGAGISAISKGKYAGPGEEKLAIEIFGAVGEVITVDEGLMDVITGLSGSGPAYIFTVIEALSDAGVAGGLSRETALKAAVWTVFGAAKMVLETGQHPAILREMVTSPAGTTIAGLKALEDRGIRAMFMEAVKEAARRAEELRK